jgi:hypothetical protein
MLAMTPLACGGGDDGGGRNGGDTISPAEVDAVYLIDLADAKLWTDPSPSLGLLLARYLTPMQLEVEATSDTAIVAKAAVEGQSRSTATEICEPQIDFGIGSIDAALTFTTHSATVPFDIPGYSEQAEARDMVVSGTIQDDGSYFTHGTIETVLDARNLEQFFLDTSLTPEGTDQPGDALCRLLGERLQVDCSVCAHDGLAYCLTITARDVSARQITSGGSYTASCD